MKNRNSSCWHGLAVALVACFGMTNPACQTMTMESGKVPVVEISGALRSEIESACDEVFIAEGYRLTILDGLGRFYEKAGTTAQEAAYGTWLGESVVERLNVRIRDLGIDAYVVECQPLLVSYAGTQLEEVRHFPSWKRGKYQNMLDEVRARLAH